MKNVYLYICVSVYLNKSYLVLLSSKVGKVSKIFVPDVAYVCLYSWKSTTFVIVMTPVTFPR